MITVGPQRRSFAAMLAAAAAIVLVARADTAELAVRPQILTNVAHPESWNTTFSADGRYFLTGNSRATVRLWEAATGRLVRSYVAKTTDDRQYVSGVGLSQSLDVVVASDRYGNVSVWKASTGQLLRAVSAGDINAQTAFVFTLDRKRMLSATTHGEVRFWDTATWKTVRTIKIPEGDVTFSPDCKSAFVRGDSAVALIDLASGRQLWRAQTGPTGAGAFSADGTRLAVGARVGAGGGNPDHSKDPVENGAGAIRVYDVRTGRELWTLTYQSQRPDVWSLAFSPDGARLLSESADDIVRTWDLQAGRLAGTLKVGLDANVWDTRLSPGGELLWSLNDGSESKIWNPQTGALLSRFGLTIGAAGRVALLDAAGRSPASAGHAASILVANVDDNDQAAVHRWNMSNGRLLSTTVLNGVAWQDYAAALVFSSDGSLAVSGTAEPPSPDDNSSRSPPPPITVWNLTTGKPTATLPGRPDKTVVAVSADGKFIFSIDAKASATLWSRADAGALWTETLKSDRTADNEAEAIIANCAVFSPNGSRLAVGGGDGVRILDVASGKVLRFLEESEKYGISSVAFAPDGRTLIEGNGDWEDNAAIWDVETGKRLHTLHGHAKVVSSVAYSPDSKHVITGGQDGTGRIWNAATGAQERLLRLDSASPFQSVTFSADGTQVISGHADGSVAIWNSATGGLIVTLVADADGEWVAITPEGFFGASPKGSALLHVVNGLDLVSIDQVFQNLFRPDLVREKLAGDPQGKVRDAAAKLDLAKILTSGAPPAIRIVEPSDRRPAPEDHAAVKIELTARDGGIGRVEWRVDGVTRAVDSNTQNVAAGATIQLDHAFPLEKGDNAIDVVAYNAKGLLASAPVQATIHWDGVAGATPPRLFVFAIGINDYYDSRLRLNYAVADAKSLSSALAVAGRNLFPVIRVATALDEEATRDHIQSIFAKLVGEMKPSDVFLFFIVGHGATIDGRYYFLPYDFRYDNENSIRDKAIDQDQLQAWFSMIPAKKSMLIFDTCESGSMTQEAVATRGLEHLVALERLTQAMGRTVLSASTATAPALEGYRNHGVYTYALLESLEKADFKHDGLITDTEIAEYVANRVPELSYQAFSFRQIPQMKIVGSSFPVAKPTDVLDIDTAPTATPATLSTIPTHVATRSLDVLATPSADGLVVRTLAPGTAVSVLLTDNGWDLIAKDGVQLGYVLANGLALLQ
ncbi:MAG: caspase family protein [Xanthobacteraceae bacterium]